MKYLKRFIPFVLSTIMIFGYPTSGSAQDWPDPLVELVSIATDSSTYFADGKIRFNIRINRINNSTYSDITRVWVCPKNSWDGFLCNAGQFLVSTTPDSTITNFIIESPVLALSDGEYVITGVSFRNGAVISGYTLMYPRSGVVTIGGIATNIALVDLAAADFTITTPTPAPAPEPEPEPTPEPEPEPAEESAISSESESTQESTVEAESSESESSESESTETSAAENTDSESAGAETTQPELDSDQPTVEVTNASNGDEAQPNAVVVESVLVVAESTEPNPENPTSLPIQPTAVVESVELKVLTPKVADELNTETVSSQNVITQLVTPELSVLTSVKPRKQQLRIKTAIGGKVLKITGSAKLVRNIAAGVGRLKLIGSNDSKLEIRLGSKLISQVNLNQDQVISWRSNKPAKLKLLLSGQSPELLIDALQLNGKLIANPSFQMRS